MRLLGFQDLLSDLYALDLAYEVDDFVTTDTDLARVLDAGGRELDEKLLIAETDGEADVSLYLDPGVLERLALSDPLERLDADNIEDFWTAFEGVSHFTYYAWNAQREKRVTMLEMELQAEVDKYVATALLLLRQGQRPRGCITGCSSCRGSTSGSTATSSIVTGARTAGRESIAAGSRPRSRAARPTRPHAASCAASTGCRRPRRSSTSTRTDRRAPRPPPSCAAPARVDAC